MDAVVVLIGRPIGIGADELSPVESGSAGTQAPMGVRNLDRRTGCAAGRKEP
jgi:hypothetical protein